MTESTRKLGYIETQMALMHSAMQGTTQGAQLIELNGRLPPNALNAAVRLVYDKYAILRCTIEERGGELFFLENARFDKTNIMWTMVGSMPHRDNLLEAEVHDILDPSTRLWRLRVWSTHDDGAHMIAFVCHHAIMDHLGVESVISDLLSYTDELADGHDVLPVNIGMPPSVDDYLPDMPDNRMAIVNDSSPIPYTRYEVIEHRRTRSLLSTLTRSRYNQLSAKCLSNRLRLNSVLSAAVAKAAYECGVVGPIVAFRTAVSLRGLVRGLSEQMALGCYISTADAVLDTQMPLEAIARDYEAKLISSIYNNCIRKVVVNLDTMRDALRLFATSSVFQGIGITNMGEAHFRRQYNHFAVADFLSLANRVAGNGAFVLHVSVAGDTVRFQFVYPEPLIDRDAVQGVADLFLSLLLDYAEGHN